MLRFTLFAVAVIALLLAGAPAIQADQFDDAAKNFPNPDKRKVYTFWLTMPNALPTSIVPAFVKDAGAIAGVEGFAGGTSETFLRMVSKEKQKIKKADVEALAKKHGCGIGDFKEHDADTALKPMSLPWTDAQFDAFWVKGRILEWEHISRDSVDGDRIPSSDRQYTWEVLSVSAPGAVPAEIEFEQKRGAETEKFKLDPLQMKSLTRQRRFMCDVKVETEKLQIGKKVVKCTVYTWSNQGSGTSGVTTDKIWLCEEVPGVAVKHETVTSTRIARYSDVTELKSWK